MQKSGDNPLVSVLLISHNHAPYIESAIESIYTQTYRNIEVVVVDDGSTDSSREIIQRLRDKFGFEYHFKQNGGVVSAVNYALQFARGEFTILHASDDISYSNRIEKQVSALSKHQSAGYVSGNLIYIDKDGKPKDVLFKKETLGTIYNFNDFMCGRARSVIVACMFRTKALKAALPLNENIPAEDYQIFMRITRSGHDCLIWEEAPVIKYRVLENSLGRKDRAALIKGQLEFLREFEKHLEYPRARAITLSQLYSITLRNSKINALRLIISREVPFNSIFDIRNLALLITPKWLVPHLKFIMNIYRSRT